MGSNYFDLLELLIGEDLTHNMLTFHIMVNQINGRTTFINSFIIVLQPYCYFFVIEDLKLMPPH